VNSGKNGGVGRDWGDLNVQPLNASLATSALLVERYHRLGERGEVIMHERP
jgi:hypothetical protein